MSADRIRELVRFSYEAYQKGDRSFALGLFHDDIEWMHYSPPEALPFPNRIKGKPAVLAALKRVDDVAEVVDNKLELIVAEGDRAATISDRAVRLRSNGRVMRYKVASFKRFQDDRLIEYVAFMDGFDLIQQALGREIAVEHAFRAVEE